MSYKNLNLEIDYQNFLDQLISGIPIISTKWTDHNPSDFGVMMLELYAYIADAYLYKINQVNSTVLINFLQNYKFDKKLTINNLDISYLNDKFDIKYSDLINQIDEKKLSGDAYTNKTIHSFFESSYRLIEQKDVESACASILPQISLAILNEDKKRNNEVTFELKGLNVEHNKERYAFDIVADIDVAVEHTDLDQNYINSAFKILLENLNRRKLLGTSIAIRAAEKISIQRVYVQLKYNTKSTEWNRNAPQLVRNYIANYFRKNTRLAELSLNHTISLFDMYTQLENLSFVEYVEKVQVQLLDTRISSQPIILSEAANEKSYKVSYSFSGDIEMENFNNDIKLSKTVSVVSII